MCLYRSNKMQTLSYYQIYAKVVRWSAFIHKQFFFLFIHIKTDNKAHRWDLEICAPLFAPLYLRSPPLLSQMELQDDGVMLGLDSSLGKDIVGIINNVFQAPWGGSHTCQKDEKALECSLCQSSILCYQLGCELLERLTPREEIRLVVRHSVNFYASNINEPCALSRKGRKHHCAWLSSCCCRCS